MIRLIKILLILAGIFCFFSQPALAKNRVLTDVKVIHASTGPNYVDPSLKEIISELKSVFKYTSYRLLKDQNLDQRFNQESRVNLPGKRVLVVMPSGMEGKRIRYQINIQKNNRSIFQTRVLLKNNSSITIGGPQFKNGVLLFNISGSVQ
ncbi:MAG: hypothetical protein K8S13_14955 [Desulfobacula sp.]|uniref:hypothetical protein n=1 Tax=Desulfobacula sp. TaxID=2593537 RepID=UPI0025BD8A75|nr:hypothetical protein [Desulfobacula sp.]MCD4721137.1 hypothetical protein [Desulfobacula sp.]